MPSNLALPIVFLVTVLGACSGGGNPSAGTPLEITYWRLLELNGRPAAGAVSERQAHLQFLADSSRVVGSTGCNRLSGPYTREGASLRFGPAAMTRMACLEAELNQQEQAFVAALTATERHTIDGDTLTLIGSSGPLARLLAQPGR